MPDALNPARGMKIEDRLFQHHDPMIAKEDWVAVNTALMQDIGAEKWLKRLVGALTTPVSLDDMQDATLNPYTVIVFAPQLREPELKEISVADWIKTNAQLIEKHSPATWLWRLLEIMEASSDTGK